MEEEDYQVYISHVSGAMEELNLQVSEQKELVVNTLERLKTTPTTTSETDEQLDAAKNETKLSQAFISDEQKLWTSWAQPPDLDYRKTIAKDQERLD